MIKIDHFLEKNIDKMFIDRHCQLFILPPLYGKIKKERIFISKIEHYDKF